MSGFLSASKIGKCCVFHLSISSADRHDFNAFFNCFPFLQSSSNILIWISNPLDFQSLDWWLGPFCQSLCDILIIDFWRIDWLIKIIEWQIIKDSIAQTLQKVEKIKNLALTGRTILQGSRQSQSYSFCKLSFKSLPLSLNSSFFDRELEQASFSLYIEATFLIVSRLFQILRDTATGLNIQRPY